MYKPLNPSDAKGVAMRLMPADSAPTSAECLEAAECLESWRTVSVHLQLAEATPASLRTLRAMFAAELMRVEGPREQILDRIMSRHVALAGLICIDSVLVELPPLAAYRDKGKKNGKQPVDTGVSAFTKLQMAVSGGIRHKT